MKPVASAGFKLKTKAQVSLQAFGTSRDVTDFFLEHGKTKNKSFQCGFRPHFLGNNDANF
jgi:hypothetical protein